MILATPFGFRPIHFEEAVNQSKQIFMEKPVATDPAGIQRVLAAAEKAKLKKIKCGNGSPGAPLSNIIQAKPFMIILHYGMIGDNLCATWWNNERRVRMHPRQLNGRRFNIKCETEHYFVWLYIDSYHRRLSIL